MGIEWFTGYVKVHRVLSFNPPPGGEGGVSDGSLVHVKVYTRSPPRRSLGVDPLELDLRKIQGGGACQGLLVICLAGSSMG